MHPISERTSQMGRSIQQNLTTGGLASFGGSARNVVRAIVKGVEIGPLDITQEWLGWL